MLNIKKKYNHIPIESEFIKKNYFTKIMKQKNKIDNIISNLSINEENNTGEFCTITQLIKEDILIKYNYMKGKTTKTINIIENNNEKKTEYHEIIKKIGIDIPEENLIFTSYEKNNNFIRNNFVELLKNGNIYENYTIIYRSIKEQKTLGTNEIKWEKKQ